MNPTFLAVLNALLSAGAAAATTQVTTSAGSTALWVLVATTAANAVAHSLSSAAPGWLTTILTGLLTSAVKKS